MRVAVDTDGCIRDLMLSLTMVYKEIYPLHEVKPITKWDLEEFFPIGKGIYDFAFKDYAMEVFYEYAEPFRGAVKALKDLKKMGHTITILTCQNQYTCQWTARWLAHFKFPYDELRVLLGDTSKSLSGKEFTDYDLYIDDSPNGIQRMLDAGKKVIRIYQPWNKEFDFSDYPCWSVSTMTDAVKIIKAMEEWGSLKPEVYE